MSPSLNSAPLSSIDLQQMRADTDPSTQTAKHISTTPVDVSLLSAYSTYQSYSNSASPSNFSTPAEVTSENSGYSEYDDFNGDVFYGVDFDSEVQVIETNPLILDDLTLPTTELPTVEAYLPQLLPDTTLSSETATNSTFPMSPNQSTPPSTHSPKSESHDLKSKMNTPQYDLSKDIPAPHATMPYDIPVSLAGGESIGLGVAPQMGHSPRVTITPWGSMEEREIPTEVDEQELQYSVHSSWHDEVPHDASADQQFVDPYTVQSSNSNAFQLGAETHEEGSQSSDEANGRTGVDPDRRRSLSAVEVPNFEEQDEYALRRQKNIDVIKWRSHADKSTDTDDQSSDQSCSTLNAPSTSTRPRARSTGAVPGYFAIQTVPPTMKDPDEGKGIEPVSPTESVRDNQLKDGRVYYNARATEIKEGDLELIQQLNYWNDAPAYPHITETKTQAPTANDAVRKWNELADNFSIISRSATWGTRRRSEPSIADMESINNGSFLKRLSLSKTKEKRPGPSALFKDSFDHLTSMVLKKGDSKLKRSRSDRDRRGRSDAGIEVKKEGQATLAPPPGSVSCNRRGQSSPCLNTNVGNTAAPGASYPGSGSVSATATSPKSTLGFVGSVIRRARSRSDVQQDPSGQGLVGLWSKESGGPPVPTLASPPVDHEAIKQQEYSDIDGDEDEDDEMADDGERMDFDQVTPITPNFAGFQEHVLRLHPAMESSYLVDRIAHQQVVRYKALLGWRVKHSGAIANDNCAAGPHCVALGGSATLFEPKGQSRDNDVSNNGLQIMTDMSDGDSNPEGALAPESFPPGVPMPPAQTLPAEFECQLCFRVKKFLKPSDWTKHVHEDVQPFTCTYPSCKEPKSFKRKADWVRHENERHRHLGWWTCTVDDCSHKCYRKDNFLQHLVREHKLPEPKQKTKAAAKKARNSDEPLWVMIRSCHHETSAKPQDEPCKFCGKVLTTWKKLTVHLAKHMEQISLSVLRLVEQQQVDANTIISPVDPLPIRQTPLPPVGADRPSSGSSGQYGRMSDSISPHPQSMSHFSSPVFTHPFQQFPNSMYGQAMVYTSTAGQEIPFNIQAPIPQQRQQHGMTFDGLPYNSLDAMGSQLHNAQSGGFTPMDHSPSMDQSGGFTAVNGAYTGPMSHPQGYHSYPSSNTTLSPDPSSFVSGPQHMPGFQAQNLSPDQAVFSSRQRAVPGFTSQQQTLSLNDESQYKFQPVNTTDNGLGYGQMPMMSGSGGAVYPPTSGGGYSYHGQ